MLDEVVCDAKPDNFPAHEQGKIPFGTAEPIRVLEEIVDERRHDDREPC
jgi:hypothetical protein